jgi:hypothetical protein
MRNSTWLEMLTVRDREMTHVRDALTKAFAQFERYHLTAIILDSSEFMVRNDMAIPHLEKLRKALRL